MDKKYNGFNNGRDKSDGVGGREVNHGTQQTMTKEQTAVEWIADRFRQYQIEGYKCNWDEVIETVLLAKEIEQQEVAKEREMYNELKAKYDSLVMDNMTLEYNAAEASEHLPDLIKQFVDQEREKAKKLVDIVERLSKMGPSWNLFGLVDEAKQSLTEYEKL